MAKKKRVAYRLYSKDTGEHYTVRLSREAFDKLKDNVIQKYSKKLKKHIGFEVKKLKIKN
jgi:ribosomal protein L33